MGTTREKIKKLRLGKKDTAALLGITAQRLQDIIDDKVTASTTENKNLDAILRGDTENVTREAHTESPVYALRKKLNFSEGEMASFFATDNFTIELLEQGKWDINDTLASALADAEPAKTPGFWKLEQKLYRRYAEGE